VGVTTMCLGNEEFGCLKAGLEPDIALTTEEWL
jgi:hypothetical protein